MLCTYLAVLKNKSMVVAHHANEPVTVRSISSPIIGCILVGEGREGGRVVQLGGGIPPPPSGSVAPSFTGGRICGGSYTCKF